MATAIGGSLKNSGLDDYTQQTRKLVGLGADLAATYGGKTSDAVQALGAALRGEYDPLDRFNVQMKQSDVNAALAARGQSNLTGKARQQAEAMAKLSIIYAKSTDAQGQAARESNSFAARTQQLTAKFTNLKSELGQRLLPVASKVLKWLGGAVDGSSRTGKAVRTLASIYNAYLRPVVKAWGDAFRIVSRELDKATGATAGSGDGIRKLGQYARPVASFLGNSFADGIRSLARTLGAIIRVISAVASGIRSIGSAARSTIEAVGALIGKLKSLPGGAIDKLAGLVRSRPLVDPGLARAGGLGLVGAAGGTQVLDLTLRSTPSVAITFDSELLRGVIRATVREELTTVARQIRRGG